jgi:hypothetical protein
MNAVDIHPLAVSPADTALGPDADVWFVALDGRVARVGDDTAILRIEGIHARGNTLWIQVALFDDAPGVVLQVEACHNQRDVLDTLAHYQCTGVPLEIIKVQTA